MQIQFERSTIPCLRRVIREIKDQEQTQEIRILDGMPDIGKILGCWGQILIRGKEWRSTGICVNGGVMTWVMYEPEDGSGVQCVDAWIPFQVKCDFGDNERDGAIVAQPMLRSIDARTVSARKLMVRADINVLCDAMTEAQIDIHMPGDVPEGIHLLENKYSVLLPKESNEKSFAVDETFGFPSSLQPVDKIVYYHVHPALVEQKVMGDKVIFRGTVGLHALLSNAAGELSCWDFELPFSQYAELGRDYSTCANAQTVLAVTSLELDNAEGENYRLRVGLTGQYVIYDKEDIAVVEDAYSPCRAVTADVSPLLLPTVLDLCKDNMAAEVRVSEGYTQLVDSMFYPDFPKIYHDGDKTTVEYGGIFRLLAKNADGELSSLTERWESVSSADADVNAKPLVSISYPTKGMVVNSGLDLLASAEIPVETVWLTGQSIPMVKGMEVGEYQTPDPDRPGIILKRYCDATLWELAKETGSTVALITEANRLEGAPEPNQMLLIPVI